MIFSGAASYRLHSHSYCMLKSLFSLLKFSVLAVGVFFYTPVIFHLSIGNWTLSTQQSRKIRAHVVLSNRWGRGRGHLCQWGEYKNSSVGHWQTYQLFNIMFIITAVYMNRESSFTRSDLLHCKVDPESVIPNSSCCGGLLDYSVGCNMWPPC